MPPSQYGLLSSPLYYPLYTFRCLSDSMYQHSSQPLSPVLFKYSAFPQPNRLSVVANEDMTLIDDIVDTATVLVKCFVMTLVASVKALLPMGVLPRKSVKGQVVLITGSGSGLGRNMAIEFAKLGSKVVLWDVNEKGNLETKKALEEMKAEDLKKAKSTKRKLPTKFPQILVSAPGG